MAARFFYRLLKKRRKYPIKRDQFGRTARQRAFELFGRDLRPAQVSRQIGINLPTACRYFADWKKQSPRLEARYTSFRDILKNHPDLSENMVRTMANELGMSVEEVGERLQRPWGLKQLLKGEWPNYARERRISRAEARLQAALDLIHMLEIWGIPPEKLREVTEAVIRAWLHEASQQQQGNGSSS
jgi:AraC-like DNA-binding protein